MARPTTPSRRPAHTADPARPVPTPLQPAATTPRPRRAHPGNRLPGHPEGRTNGLNPANPHYRLRLDHVDNGGKISLRRAGRMHHLGVGYIHRQAPAIVLTDATTATVIHRDTGEVLSTHDIDPSRTYWRNKDREPGRWPGSQR